MKPIPISAAKFIAKTFGYDQVVIYARKVGKGPNSGEHLTTYGVNEEHCKIASLIAETLKRFMGWETNA